MEQNNEPKEKMEVEEEIIYENLDNGQVLQKYKASAEVANGKEKKRDLKKG